MWSNIRSLDCTNRPEAVFEMAKELGLSGLAITDHEALCSHIVVNQLAEKYPELKIALGNEIYLTDTRDSGQKYYHFILIAKDEAGYLALKELSSTAWYYSYSDRGQERVPTLKSELRAAVEKYGKGHLIATSACIGGELSSNALLFAQAKAGNNIQAATEYYHNIVNFLDCCLNLFGEDFYIECAPAASEDQILVNQTLLSIANAYGVKMTLGNDSHYRRPEDRWIHKAFLNSREGEREVDKFYEYCYMKSSDEVRELLLQSFSDNTVIDKILANSLEIQNKITSFSLHHHEEIPDCKTDKIYDKGQHWFQPNTDFYDEWFSDRWPNLRRLSMSDDEKDRYWINQCMEGVIDMAGYNETYFDRLEEEARVKTIIGEKLQTNMFRYPITLQHYINLIWDCGSMVGAGRGSSCAALNHAALKVTQLDPVQWNLPFFRYLNEERVELGCLLLILPSCK